MDSPLSDDRKLALAEALAAAAQHNDADAYRSLCAPGSVTWHNFDEVEVPVEGTLAAIAWLHRKVPDLAWETLAVTPTPGGWVSQSVMTGTAPGGPLRVHSCVVVTLDAGGLVARVEEYLDPAQTAVVRA